MSIGFKQVLFNLLAQSMQFNILPSCSKARDMHGHEHHALAYGHLHILNWLCSARFSVKERMQGLGRIQD